MTTYELLEQLNELLEALEPNSKLEKLLSEIASNYDEAIGFVNAVAASNESNAALQNARNVAGKIQAAVDLTKSIGPGYTYIQLSDWMRRLAKLQVGDESPLGEAMTVLLNAGQQFYDQYDKFVREPVASQTLKLMSEAQSLGSVIRFTREFAQGLLQLRPSIVIAESEAELSLFLPITGNLKDIVTKVAAIQAIYDELAQLLSISTSEYPLRVVKVESGTLWTKLFGESKVVSLIVKLIERTVGYMYRNYTVEGGLVQIPKTVEAVDAVLHLKNDLEEAGVDTSSMKENLEKAGIVVSKKLNDLLTGQPNVVINGTKHSIGEEFHERFLKESRMLFLDAGDDLAASESGDIHEEPGIQPHDPASS